MGVGPKPISTKAHMYASHIEQQVWENREREAKMIRKNEEMEAKMKEMDKKVLFAKFQERLDSMDKHLRLSLG